jgi:hypothetical protein
MRNPNVPSYYPATTYHDTPDYFEQVSEPGQMVLLAIHRNLVNRNESTIGHMQLMVFPPRERPSSRPTPEAVVTNAPYLASYARLPRGSELMTRGLPRTIDSDPYKASASKPGAPLPMWRHDRPENFPRDKDTSRLHSTDAPSARQFFADPGLLRILRFSDFHTQLRPQLQHPEYIRESHQLPCYVQVFEVAKPGSVEEIASHLGFSALAYQFAILDARVAGKLGLSNLPQSNRSHLRRTPCLLLPGDRVFRLEVVRDPTIACSDSQSVGCCVSGTTATGKDIPEHSTSKPLKSTIPETYLSPWEFEKTREEALRELSAESSGWLRNVWRAVRAWTKSHEIRNWRSLLIGKSVDDQLWGVPPPKWALNDRAVRRWARRTLALAAYDSDVMFPEWEIFWRRKGF